ncbi:MAG: ribosomal protein L7/L12 [Gammaproteobacteria bacterium]|nr:ribosomal protein L7/L12 [Gammaproteobacteria bacterium]MDH5801506.1 ribosomal protein L7/L12 [Gammaproteobacteria bacterium]
MNFIEIVLLFVAVSVVVTVITLIVNRKSVPGIESDSDVLAILNAGDKIKAIKAYRQLHGVGLKEAKQSLEKMTQNTN